METFDAVSLEIMWSRLLNIAEEMWTTTLRTAVSTIIASANDFGCEVLDERGRSIVHAYRSMPVFNMTMPNVTKAILQKYPLDTIKPGDVFLTNDPWLCAGHLPDIAIITPVFYQGRFIGFTGNIANTSDGRRFTRHEKRAGLLRRGHFLSHLPTLRRGYAERTGVRYVSMERAGARWSLPISRRRSPPTRSERGA